MEGAVERVRPKMMTVVAIMAGLLPILWSHGTGSEVMQRIAVPMIGGMVSSTMLTLIVIPAVYALVKGIGLERFSAPVAGASSGVVQASIRRSRRNHTIPRAFCGLSDVTLPSPARQKAVKSDGIAPVPVTRITHNTST